MTSEFVLEKVPISERREFRLDHVNRREDPVTGRWVQEMNWRDWGERKTRESYLSYSGSDEYKNMVTPKLQRAMETSGMMARNALPVAGELDEYGRPPGVEISWNKIGEIIDKHGRKGVKPALLPQFGPRVDHNSMLEYLFLCDRAKTFANVKTVLYWEEGGDETDNIAPYLPRYVQCADYYYHPSQYNLSRGYGDLLCGRPATVVADDLGNFEMGGSHPIFDLVVVVAHDPGSVLERLCEAGRIDHATGIYARRNVGGLTSVWQRVNKQGVVLSRMVASCGNRTTQPEAAGIITNCANVRANLSEMLSDNILQVGWQAVSRVRYVAVTNSDMLKAEKCQPIEWVGDGGPGVDLGPSHYDQGEYSAYHGARSRVTSVDDYEDLDEIPVCVADVNSMEGIRLELSDDEVSGPPLPFIPAEVTRVAIGVAKSYPRPVKWYAEEINIANHVHNEIIHKAKDSSGVAGAHLCCLEAGREENVKIVGVGTVVVQCAVDVNIDGAFCSVPDKMNFTIPRDTYVDPYWNTLKCPAVVAIVPLRLRATLEWPRLKITLIESGDLWAAVRLHNYFYCKLGKIAHHVSSGNMDRRVTLEHALSKFVYPKYTVIWNILTHEIGTKMGRRHNSNVIVDRGWVHAYTTPPENGKFDYEKEKDGDPGRRIVYEAVMTCVPALMSV